MPVHQGLDLGRPNLVSGRIDHAFEPVDHEKVAVFIDSAEIAGAQKSLAVDFDKRLGAVLGLVPVAQEHLRAVRDDLADFALGQFAQRDGIDHARVDSVNGNAQTLLFRALGRIDVRGCHGLR